MHTAPGGMWLLLCKQTPHQRQDRVARGSIVASKRNITKATSASSTVIEAVAAARVWRHQRAVLQLVEEVVLSRQLQKVGDALQHVVRSHVVCNKRPVVAVEGHALKQPEE